MSRIKRHIALLAAVMLAMCVSASASEVISDDRILADEVNYNTVTAEYGDLVKTNTTSASAYYPSTTTVYYEGAAAVYVNSSTKRGSEVREGDVLMTLEPIRDDAKVEEMTLSIQRSEEALAYGISVREDAIADLNEQLEKQHNQYDKRRTQLNIELASVQLVQYRYQQERSIADQKEALEELLESYSVTTVTAPCNGIIESQSSFRAGTTVGSGALVCVIQHTDVMLLAAQSDKLRYGMEVTIETGSNKDKVQLKGRVVVAPDKLVNASIDYKLIEVTSDLPQKATWKNTKITGNTIELRSVLIIDSHALTTSSGTDYVRKLTDGGAVQKRSVIRGLSDQSHIWILQGLSAGETVILE